MDKVYTVALLEKKLGMDDRTDIMELTLALEFIPLAIIQAVAYIL